MARVRIRRCRYRLFRRYHCLNLAPRARCLHFAWQPVEYFRAENCQCQQKGQARPAVAPVEDWMSAEEVVSAVDLLVVLMPQGCQAP